ncbi:ribonuclease P protein component [Candidatus Saccharibacteria bacterium]|nr:ribonuclease P protein component [Candidatus Saccharibacteria bacterium]
MLKRVYRLRKNSDFQRLYKSGKRFTTPNLVLYYMPSNFDYSQVGFVVSKKVSKKAVVRNSLRRRAGAIVEASYPKLKTPTKMIILIRRDFSALTPSELNKEITTLLGRQVL